MPTHFEALLNQYDYEHAARFPIVGDVPMPLVPPEQNQDAGATDVMEKGEDVNMDTEPARVKWLEKGRLELETTRRNAEALLGDRRVAHRALFQQLAWDAKAGDPMLEKCSDIVDSDVEMASEHEVERISPDLVNLAEDEFLDFGDASPSP